METEKRKLKRQPLGYAARVRSLDGAFEVECMILDVSERGAKLKVTDAAVLPDEFILVLAQSGQSTRRCSVAWRRSQQVGVAFQGRELPSPRA